MMFNVKSTFVFIARRVQLDNRVHPLGQSSISPPSKNSPSQAANGHGTNTNSTSIIPPTPLLTSSQKTYGQSHMATLTGPSQIKHNILEKY